MRWILILALIVAAAVPAAAQAAGGAALRFDGSDDWLDCGAIPDVSTTFTLEAWVMPARAGTTMQFIVGPHGSDGCFKGAGFVQLAGTETVPGNLAFVVGLAGCANDVVISGPVPTLGQWYHLAGTYDNGTMRFYVDGTLAGERTAVGYSPFPRFVAGSTFDRQTGRPGFFFGGDIDDVRVWGYARTQAEIEADMPEALAGTETGLAAYWSMDEGSGQFAREVVGDGSRDGRLGNDAVETGDAADPLWLDLSPAPAPPPPAPTPVEAIEKLIQAVQDAPMKSYFKRGLALKLWVARAVLRDSTTRNDHVAVKALRTFVRTVNALAGRKIPAETAAELTAAARDIIYTLENEVVDRCRGRDCWWDRRGDDDD